MEIVSGMKAKNDEGSLCDLSIIVLSVSVLCPFHCFIPSRYNTEQIAIVNHTK